MQQPTLRGVRIRSSQDVHRIFYGVQIGRLKMLERRLDNKEREALTSGCVYVWEERGSRNVDVTGEGMDRFTEGKQWGPSRVRDLSPLNLPLQRTTSAKTHAWDRLIKQTYSAWFDTPTGRRKWHLSVLPKSHLPPLTLIAFEAAYFSDNTIDRLYTIDDLPALRDIRAPPGIFECAKSNKSKSKRRQSGERVDSQRSTSSAPQDPPFSLSFSLEPVTMIQPYVAKKAPNPSTVHPLPPIQPPPSHVVSVPPPLQGGFVLSHASSRHAFSLPPIDTFVYAGDLYRTPSPTSSGNGSLLSRWDPSHESSCNASEHGYMDSARALAPIYGPKQRIYVRDPLDDKPGIYRAVIDDVMANIKSEFDEYGVSEDVLAELQHKWENKVIASHVAEFEAPTPAPASQHPAAPHPLTYQHPLMMHPHYPNPFALPQPGMSAVKAEPIDSRYILHHGMPYALPPLAGPVLNGARPPLPGQAPQHPGGQTGVIAFPRQLPPQTQTPRPPYTAPAAAQAQPPAPAASQPAQRISQVDGPSESSGDEDDSPPPSQGQAFAPRTSHPSLPQPRAATSAAPAPAADSEAINSDLDDSDTEGEEEADEGVAGETDIVFCTYDKVARVKNKWKCILKDVHFDTTFV
ncbi:hypothetical protein C0995_014395 [Termitomyces sp. Mi166|nr:hypothetical protein C0995_014395 [Termitomyces sp. Mi166\